MGFTTYVLPLSNTTMAINLRWAGSLTKMRRRLNIHCKINPKERNNFGE